MAKLTAYQSLDMSDTRSDVGITTYADENLLIVETDDSSSFYYGDFTYPDNVWEGVIERLQVYDVSGTLVLEYRGLEIDTRFATSGTTVEEALQEAFKGDDRITGSRSADVLIGFNGDDAIRGGGGDDALQGRRGVDALRGGGGDDVLRGCEGRDLLTGGRGDDVLRGEESRDVFVFGERDGRDVIRDFQNRRDKIQIEGGASDFDELEISEIDDGAHVAFGRTEITLRDVDVADLGPADFLFV